MGKSWSPRIFTQVALGAFILILIPNPPSRIEQPRIDARFNYGWPVKPFNEAHPVRGTFGDLRTVFDGLPTPEVLMTGSGSFTFHFGVDISVPDGTPVYPVKSGTAFLRGGRTVEVDSGNGFAAQYWHIIPTITAGQKVVANETVLGHVMKGYGHVHFSELAKGQLINPLATGHMGPYEDTNAPVVNAITFREAEGRELLPECIKGRVDMVVQAFDKPNLPVPGIWAGLPTAPALITWRIERFSDGKEVVPEGKTFDVRRTLPHNNKFWRYYARGSRQNMSTFKKQRAWRVPGNYLFCLTREAFDTTQMSNGIYTLIVTASDIRGNQGTGKQTFIVRNGADSMDTSTMPESEKENTEP